MAAPILLESDLLFTVGAAGDYTSLNAALLEASRYVPCVAPSGTVPVIEIRQLAGFVMEEQVYIRGLNLSHVKITSIDHTVVIDKNALTQSPEGQNSAFTFSHGALAPVIGTLYDMQAASAYVNGTARKNGLLLQGGAYAHVLPGKGFRRACANGAAVYPGSLLIATGTYFDACGENGVLVTGARADVSQSNVGGGYLRGVYAAHGGYVMAAGANARLNSGSNTALDLAVTRMGNIIADASLGGANVAFNTVTSHGTVFDSTR